MACVFDELEAELIGERTKVAVAVAKAQGTQRRQGESLRAIADVLNHAGITAPDGGRWYPATVSRVSKRVEV